MRAIDINSFFASIASITNSNKGDISVQRGGIVGGGIQIDYFSGFLVSSKYFCFIFSWCGLYHKYEKGGLH